jgi:hypothetical protein
MVSETMVGFYGAEPEAVAKAYDFSQFETVVDIGGATGNAYGDPESSSRPTRRTL